MDNINIVRNYYDSTTEAEWNRLERHRIEFEITKRFLDKYISPRARVLDIGGGPGRYSLYLAGRGCDVTLFDLSKANTDFALSKAAEQGLKINAVCGDARQVDSFFDSTFDHILLMGPMYHLLDEADRTAAVNSALRLLKPGGVLFVSFISLFAGLSYYMKNLPGYVTEPTEKDYINTCINGDEFSGDGFTKVYFIHPEKIDTFMSQFSLKKLHLFGQEGISSPGENNIMACTPEVIDKWIDICFALCEKREFLSFPEHLMYVGRKI